MGNTATFQSVVSGEALLRRTVEALLPERLGYSAKVDSLTRRPCPFATLFPAEVLSIDFENGKKLSLFLKHLGPEESDDPEKQCRDREVRIYEELLTDDSLPVAKYYGSNWNQVSGRLEVFLEYVDDWNLRYHGMEHWFTAARRLAQMHAHFAGRAGILLACDFLLQFNGGYLYEWVDRALAAVTQHFAELASELKPVVKSYGRVVEMLASQPLTLVHNDLSPKNVIAGRSSNPARICFVDWEMSGAGCGLIDLSHLNYGLDPENNKKMCDAYYSELAGTSLCGASRAEWNRVLAACELVNTVHRLARSNIWGIPFRKVREWIAEAHRALSRI